MNSPCVGMTVGRYQLNQELGHGGMGTVFRARDPHLGRDVAVKVLHPHLCRDRTALARFAREARALGAIDHPGIIAIHDFGEGDPRSGAPSYLVTELICGRSLSAFLRAGGHPLPHVAAMIALTISEALAAAHERDVIHRDVKPDNVLISEDGRVVLTDFGIARLGGEASVTQTGALVGSPGYMSPEQAAGGAVDARSDLFSLGVLLYELASGRLPFSSERGSPVAAALAALHGRYEPLQKVNAQVTRQLETLVDELLAADPGARVPSAQALAVRLRGQLGELGLDEPAAELTRYFADPGSYNRALVPRLVERAMTLAHQAQGGGNTARALSHCDFVLSTDPDHKEALLLIADLARSSARRRALRVFLGVVALAALVSGGYLGARHFGSCAGPGVERRNAMVAARGGDRARDARKDSDWLARPDSGAAPRSVPVAMPGPDNRARRFPNAPARPRTDGIRPLTDAGGPGAGHGRTHSRRAGAETRIGAGARRNAGFVDGGVALDQPRGVASASAPDGAVSSAKSKTPRVSPTLLEIRLGPYCNAFLDGRPVGVSPIRDPLAVAPGEHVVDCVNGPSMTRTRRVVHLVAGERKTLRGPIVESVEVTLRLTRYEALRIDGQLVRGRTRLVPKPYRVDPVRGGRVLEQNGRYVTIPSRGCVLVDTPALECR